jgi:hypothetical protein
MLAPPGCHIIWPAPHDHQPMRLAGFRLIDLAARPATHTGFPLDRDESTEWLLDRSTRLGLEYLRNRLPGTFSPRQDATPAGKVTLRAKRSLSPARRSP